MKRLLIALALLTSQSAMALDWYATPSGVVLTGEGVLITACDTTGDKHWTYHKLPMMVPSEVIESCDGWTISAGRLDVAWYR